MRGEARGTQTHARARGATGTVPHPRPPSPARPPRPGARAATQPRHSYTTAAEAARTHECVSLSVCLCVCGGEGAGMTGGGGRSAAVWGGRWTRSAPLRTPRGAAPPGAALGGGRLAGREPGGGGRNARSAAPPRLPTAAFLPRRPRPARRGVLLGVGMLGLREGAGGAGGPGGERCAQGGRVWGVLSLGCPCMGGGLGRPQQIWSCPPKASRAWRAS